MLLRSNHGKRLLAVIRFWASGSEGIGNGNKLHRFTPNTDSLENPVSAVFVTACYSVDPISIARLWGIVNSFYGFFRELSGKNFRDDCFCGGNVL